jgi:hypothetical protein
VCICSHRQGTEATGSDKQLSNAAAVAHSKGLLLRAAIQKRHLPCSSRFRPASTAAAASAEFDTAALVPSAAEKDETFASKLSLQLRVAAL